MIGWWKIKDKPRGRWRPILNFGISFNADEVHEIKQLNIPRSIWFCFIHVQELPSQEIKPTCGAITVFFLEKGYSSRNDSDTPFDYSFCEECSIQNAVKVEKKYDLWSLPSLLL
jgi:hypothetical protein